MVYTANWGLICYRSHLLGEPETAIEKSPTPNPKTNIFVPKNGGFQVRNLQTSRGALFSGAWLLVSEGSWWSNPPSEKYARQNGFIFPKDRGENKTYLKPPPSI